MHSKALFVVCSCIRSDQMFAPPQTNLGAAPVNYTYSPGTPPTIFGPETCMEVDSQFFYTGKEHVLTLRCLLTPLHDVPHRKLLKPFIPCFMLVLHETVFDALWASVHPISLSPSTLSGHRVA